MLEVVRRNGNDMYPLLSNNALIMSIGTLGKTTSTAQRRPTSYGKPTVKAATVLGQNSSTEIIDISGLSQKASPLIQYVEIADAAGRLYCVNRQVKTSCWLKIVTIAKDCQSCNVLLMTTDKGVVLKTIRSITPGEPLLMWFTENILAMLNMPYLTNLNIKGENRYICHVCNNHFEYPNPLKIHLALKCNRLDSNYLWTQLANEFCSLPPHPPLSINFFQKLPPFRFELSNSPRASPTRVSPILIDLSSVHGASNMANNSANFSNHSPTSSNQTSPTSSNQTSPTSPGQMSYCSSKLSSTTQVSPVKKNLGQCHSAFKPYINKPSVFPTNVIPPLEKIMLAPYHLHQQADTALVRPDVQAAQMETIVSNLGKSKQGHQCIYCGKMYSRKYGLKIHIRTHTGYKPLKCKYCLRPFGDPSNLNKHVRLHADGETPYRCDLCGKVLVRRRDLERHIRSRHQESAGHISDESSDGMDS